MVFFPQNIKLSLLKAYSFCKRSVAQNRTRILRIKQIFADFKNFFCTKMTKTYEFSEKIVSVQTSDYRHQICRKQLDFEAFMTVAQNFGGQIG